MQPTLQTHTPTAYAMPPQQVTAVMSTARSLQRAAATGRVQRLLRGKNFGLLCDSPDAPAARLFRDAAAELGGHVSHIRPNLTEWSTEQDVRHTARMLGRLYDAVECQGLPSSLVQQVGQAAGVPIFDAVASDEHPSARLVEEFDDQIPPDASRRFVLQAVLLNALS